MGYSVVDLSTSKEILFFGNVPNQTVSSDNVLILPNNIQIFCPEVDKTYVEKYKYVKRYIQNGTDEKIEYDGSKVIVTKPIQTLEPSLEELQQQLALIQDKISKLNANS